MTRKDYVRFAAMLKDQLIACDTLRMRGVKRNRIISVINATADIFAADNPRFDRSRFLKACGVES